MPDRAARRGAESSTDGRSASAALAPLIKALRDHAARTGLDRGERQQVKARRPTELSRQAKQPTGLDTDLLTIALAKLVAEDAFADACERTYG